MLTTVAHVGGRRTLFIPDLTGKRAPWERVIETAADASDPSGVASAATVRRADHDAERAWVDTTDLRGLKAVTPDGVLDVRRPVAYQGMSNYPSTLCVPTRARGWRSVWCESFNEQANYRDFLLDSATVEFATQMMRLEWVFPTGIRVHYPDAMALDASGMVTLLDVTTRRRFQDARVAAVFELTRRTCEALGWRYLLRFEPSPQRIRNINALWGRRHHDPALSERWVRAAEQAPSPVQFHVLARLLGDGKPNVTAVMHLLATRRFRADLDAPLRPDSRLDRSPVREEP